MLEKDDKLVAEVKALMAKMTPEDQKSVEVAASMFRGLLRLGGEATLLGFVLVGAEMTSIATEVVAAAGD